MNDVTNHEYEFNENENFVTKNKKEETTSLEVKF